MYDFQRQHPVAAISRALDLIKGNFITILVFVFVGAQSENLLYWIGGGFAFLLVLGIANWWRFLYKIEDGELHIKSGIFVRKNLYLTKDRIQVIDVTSGIIQRLFGLVRLDIQTAGSTSREAAIEALTKDKAQEINRLLRADGSEKTADDELETEQVVEKSDVLDRFKLPWKELLIAASTSGSFGIAFSILATLFSQIEPVISQSELFEYLFGMLPSQTDAMLVITILLLFIVFAWLLSFFSTLLKYGNFVLEVKEKEIVILRGIFEKKRITVPYNRIQAIHITEGIIRQPLGYASLQLESAGYGDDKGTGSITMFPLIKRDDIFNFLKGVVPEYQKKLDGVKPPKRALRRYIFRSAFIITAVTAALYWIMDLNNWIWFLPLLSVLWGWLKYKNAAAGWDEEMFILRSRFLSKTTAFIMRNRVQDARLSTSFFQDFRNLCTVQIHVASGDQGKSFSVKDIEKEDGYRLLRQVRKTAPVTESATNEENISIRVPLPDWRIDPV